MAIKDEQGRIMQLEYDDSITWGHSVCNACHKDMPSVWDVVCIRCNKTFCYDHAVTYCGCWYCEQCAPSILR